MKRSSLAVSFLLALSAFVLMAEASNIVGGISDSNIDDSARKAAHEGVALLNAQPNLKSEHLGSGIQGDLQVMAVKSVRTQVSWMDGARVQV